MKQTKSKDLRGLSADELKKKSGEARESLFKLKLRKATRQLEDSSGLRALRRDIARYETLARAASAPTPAGAKAGKKAAGKQAAKA